MLGSKCFPCCSCGNIAPIDSMCAYSVRIFGYDTWEGRCFNGGFIPSVCDLPANNIGASSRQASPNFPPVGRFVSQNDNKPPATVPVGLLDYTGAARSCFVRQSDNQLFCPREQVQMEFGVQTINGRQGLFISVELDATGYIPPDAIGVFGRITFSIQIVPTLDFSDDADFCDPAPGCGLGYPPASWGAYGSYQYISKPASGGFSSVKPIDEMPIYTARCGDAAVLDRNRSFCPQKFGSANCKFCPSWHLPNEVPVLCSIDTGINVNGVQIPMNMDISFGDLSQWTGPREVRFTIVKHEKCCFTDCDPNINHCCPSKFPQCDCKLDLTGRSVEFQGQEFTYGSRQTFSSDDGLIVWEESPTGTFRKIIYDNCDPSQRIKTFEETAEVFCTNIDGTDFWAVQLIVQCFERDACFPPFDRSRTITWNGILECDFNGYPFGSSETEFASNIPSNPAPTGSCISLPEIPSFSFT